MVLNLYFVKIKSGASRTGCGARPEIRGLCTLNKGSRGLGGGVPLGKEEK